MLKRIDHKHRQRTQADCQHACAKRSKRPSLFLCKHTSPPFCIWNMPILFSLRFFVRAVNSLPVFFSLEFPYKYLVGISRCTGYNECTD